MPRHTGGQNGREPAPNVLEAAAAVRGALKRAAREQTTTSGLGCDCLGCLRKCRGEFYEPARGAIFL
jgi:hypothetical protein